MVALFAILEARGVAEIFAGSQESLEFIHRLLEIEIISPPREDVQLACKLRCERVPIPFHVGAQIPVLNRPECGLPVDLAGDGIPYLSWISVLRNRSESRVPGGPLTARAIARPDHFLVDILVLHRVTDPAIHVSGAGDGRTQPVILAEVGVIAVVEVDELVVMEVDLVRIKDPRPAEVVRIQHLLRDGLPTACRTTREDSGPGLADAPELRFERRQQLMDDGIAIRPLIL